MAIISKKPTSHAMREYTTADYSVLTKKEPEKNLLKPVRKTGGRNSYGRITVRHIGGGNRQKYRVIDFMRKKDGIPAKVVAIEYDPNRSAYVALLNYVDGEKSYILAPEGLNVGATVMSGPNAEISVGNCLPIENMPVGITIHNIELEPNAGGVMARSAGIEAMLMAKENGRATLRLPSGEMRTVDLKCRATVGQVGNLDHEIVSIGKAGRMRHMGVRTHFRGA